MGKETFYFSHDYNSRTDPKMVKLLMSCGLDGIAIYWCVIEMLYEEGGYLMRTDCERIAFELRTDCERIEKVINSPLFKNDNERFWSESVLRRLKLRKEKSDKAQASALIKWENIRNANGMRTHSDGNAIKESKIKENKKGVKFNEEKTAVYFDDGSMQKLGTNQLFRLTQDDLIPEKVFKGVIS